MSRRRDDLKALFSGEPLREPPAPEQKALSGRPNMLEGPVPGYVPSPPPPPPGAARASSGALKAMGLELDGLRAAAEEAERLKSQLTQGEAVVDVDAALIDPAFVRDRMATSGGDDAALAASIAESGQQVPVLLRPRLDAPGRFEAVFGHRRVAAARGLGRPVRAVIRAMSDEELVVAQGQENNQRRDLSFIEKARFAASLERRGFSRRVIMAALDAHKADIARYMSVAEALPDALVEAIGPAPGAGRPRWMALAVRLEAAGRDLPQPIRSLIVSPAFAELDSDARFRAVGEALEAVVGPAPRGAVPSPGGAVWTSADGRLRAEAVARGVRGADVRMSGPDGAAFAAFVAARLQELHAAFVEKRGGVVEKKSRLDGNKENRPI
jgi:ParB family transcriptional regulator, chromosome partitioning protein